MNSRHLLPQIAALTCALLVWQPVSAHDWYIQAVEYTQPGPGAGTIYQGWGHKVPLDGTMDGGKIASLRLLGPDGSSTDLPVAPGRSFHVTPIELTAPGTYTVLGESVPGYYQIYRGKDGQVHHTTQALDELTDVDQVFFSCRAFQNPKTYLVVGEGNSAPGPVGSGLEIVPDQAPGTLHAGDRLAFRVLRDGAPVTEGATYDATYMGYSALPEDYLYMNREVVAGSGQVDLSAPGVWYLRVHLLTPAPEELRAKCRQFMYNATLTLNVGERQKTEARVTQDD